LEHVINRVEKIFFYKKSKTMRSLILSFCLVFAFAFSAQAQAAKKIGGTPNPKVAKKLVVVNGNIVNGKAVKATKGIKAKKTKAIRPKRKN